MATHYYHAREQWDGRWELGSDRLRFKSQLSGLLKPNGLLYKALLPSL